MAEITETELLVELAALCACSLTVSINDHRAIYRTAAQFIEDHEAVDGDPIAGSAVRDEMIRLDTIIEVHCYPKHPVSFYQVFHHDLRAALLEMRDTLKASR